MHLPPVRPEDKRMVNGKTDINQLAPFKYPWAWEYFLNANENHWTPVDIQMMRDLEDYNSRLSDEEKHMYTTVLAYLTTSDILAMRNVSLAVMEKVTAPEVQIYMARQTYEESLHTWAYQHCIETLGLDQGEIYNRYRVVPEIHNKIRISNERLAAAMAIGSDLSDPINLHEFLISYMFFACVFEGAWFYNGFTPIFALQRINKMRGTGEQLQYIMRDESLHCLFGITAIKQIMAEERIQMDKNRLRDMWEEVHEAEREYIDHVIPNPMMGYNSNMHMEQFRFLCNRRAKSLGVEVPFPGAVCAIPWLDEQVNLRKEKNFFETKVTEYRAGGSLRWDD
jgi:ribonucleoside-diphosphate reductase beta chain